MEYKLSHISEIVGGKLFLFFPENDVVEDVLLDSRKLISPHHILFFALTSKKGNGHHYITELKEKGVKNFIVSNEELIQDKSGVNYILVQDTLAALQKFAGFHRKQYSYPVIGITGSNGKTMVKEWLFQLLHEDKKIVRSPKSYNSQIGVPLSVWQMSDHHELAIIEAGISEVGEMDQLQKIIQPDIGIITNIGEAHDENFINHNQKAGEKLKLFTQCKTLIYSLDAPFVQETILRSGLHEIVDAFTWSYKHPAHLQILEVSQEPSGFTHLKALYKDQSIAIKIPFSDHASIENAIHCWAFLLYMNVEQEIIAKRMEQLHKVAMRLELNEGINHCTLINDSYNSDFNSLTIALDFLAQQNQHKKKTIILSDVLQSGKSDVFLYGRIAELLDKKGVEKLVGIGPAIMKHQGTFNQQKCFYPSTRDFLEKHLFSDFQNESILIKGARAFEFEKISKALQQKDHQTVMEINLNAIEQNLHYFRKKIHPDTMIMAMVKAFSYGTGSFEIANTLQFHHVDYLAVAYADEGVELRKRGIHLPIMVMNPDEHSFDAIIQHNLEPEVYNFRSLRLLEKAIGRNIIPRNKPVKIHLKIDTGMHRLGFMPNELDALINRIKINSRLYLISVFSHLAASDDPAADAFTHQQIDLFKRMSAHIQQSFSHRIFKHILNSAGIHRFSFAQMDLVRLGISLYGISSIQEEQSQLEVVSSLKTVVSQIKEINAGETVGYNRAWKAEGDSLIAIIPIGYADGLSRALGNGNGHVMIKGNRYPVIGHVCMDMCMIDITGSEVEEGDEVEIFGRKNDILQLAGEMNTIPYEVLSRISRRVKRVYYHE